MLEVVVVILVVVVVILVVVVESTSSSSRGSRINHEIDSAWQVQYLMKLKGDFFFASRIVKKPFKEVPE